MTDTLWLDLRTAEVVDAPKLPEDLTGCWDFALEVMDQGLVRWRGFRMETTAPIPQVLDMLRVYLGVDPKPLAVAIHNLRTGAALHTSTEELLAPPKVFPVKPELVLRDPLTYTFPDICDANTLLQQHHAVYGAWLHRDLKYLDLPHATKTLTFAAPDGHPYIRWATRHQELGHRLIYLITGWTYEQALTRVSLPVAWADADTWEGVRVPCLRAGPLPFNFLDPDEVFQSFGAFDLAEVNNMRILAARAHGWNKLLLPRAWEGQSLPPGLQMLL